MASTVPEAVVNSLSADDQRRSVYVTALSKNVTETDLREYFAYSGSIKSISMTPDGNNQAATVTFEEVASAQSASFLSGAVVRDSSITVASVVPSDGTGGFAVAEEPEPATAGQTVRKGLVAGLASVALFGSKIGQKVKEVDDKVGVSRAAERGYTKAAATGRKVDSKLGLSEKATVASAAVSNAASRVDNKLGVSTKTKAAGSAIKESTVGQSVAGAGRKAKGSISNFNADVKGKIAEKRMSQELPSPPDLPPEADVEGGSGGDGNDNAPSAPPPDAPEPPTASV